MKLKPKSKRKPGTCDALSCLHPRSTTVEGTFFSKRAGDLGLCPGHFRKAEEMAEGQGISLVIVPTPTEEEGDPRAALSAEMATEATEAKEALGEFEAFDIITKDDLAFAAEMLAEVKGHYKRLDDKRKTVTKPLNDALKATRALFKPALDYYKECETALKGKMGEAHQRAQQEQREALAEAQEAAASGDGGAVTDALNTMEDASSFPEVDGVQYRSKWRFEITDEDAVPREYCTPDLKLIGGVVTHRKGSTEIPGVRVYEDTIIASKSA